MMSRHGELSVVWAALLLVATGCGPGKDFAIVGCEPGDGLAPICGFHNPEDIVLSPSGRLLVVSQLSSEEEHAPGSLVVFDPATSTKTPLLQGARIDGASGEWGSSECTPLELGRINPHGIDIEQRSDGRSELFVVNHGDRESVELFEVVESDVQLTLVPRGCVNAPPNAFLNDVVGLRDGGFWASHMYPHDSVQTLVLLRMLLTSYAPGMAYEWKPDSGFRIIPGTEVQFGNGVEKSEDERFLFLNGYLGNEVVKIDVAAGRRMGNVTVEHPDNLSWSPDGLLLVASHRGSILKTKDCFSLKEGTCPVPFAIVGVNTDTMTARTLLEQDGPPMGAATVARVLGEDVYLGTFAGDRIARLRRQRLQTPAADAAIAP